MIKNLTKATFNDLRTQARDMLSGYLDDMDETHLYMSAWTWDDDEEVGKDVTTKYPYIWANGVLTVDKDSGVIVVKDTSYTEIKEENLIEKRLGFIEKTLSKLFPTKQTKDILKHYNVDKMEILEPLYIAGGEVDGTGDGYADDIEGPVQLSKAVAESIETGNLQYSLYHKHKTNSFEIIKAWTTEEAVELDDGTVIPAKQPLVITKFHNEKAYQARVEGRLGGLSIGARGSVEVIKDLLSDLKVSETPSRLLSNFIMSHKGAHVAYTSWSQGGAASLKNEPFQIMKSKITLTDEEKSLLEEIGEELTELEKAKLKASDVSKTAPSTSVAEAQDAGVDNETVNKGNNNMSEKDNDEKLLKAFKEIKALKIEKSLGKYNLSSEVSEALADSLAELESTSAVIKALDAVVEASVEKASALEAEIKTLKEEKEEINKAKTPLESEMNKELGGADGEEASEEEIAKAAKAEDLALAKKELKVG